jgi:hypothetical protein
MEGIAAQCLIADRGYDSDTLIEQGIKTVIPPRKNRTKHKGCMMGISTNSAIWWKTPFST